MSRVANTFRPICPHSGSCTLAACKSAKWYPQLRAASGNCVRSPLNSLLHLRIRPSLLAQFMNKSEWSNSSDHYSARLGGRHGFVSEQLAYRCMCAFGAVVRRAWFAAHSVQWPMAGCFDFGKLSYSVLCCTQRIINFVSKHTHRTRTVSQAYAGGEDVGGLVSSTHAGWLVILCKRFEQFSHFFFY